MNTDVYHVTIAGINPHQIARDWGEDKDSPFYEERTSPSVSSPIIVNDKIVGGIVEIWGPEHLESIHKQYLQGNPYVIDVRHAYPEVK